MPTDKEINDLLDSIFDNRLIYDRALLVDNAEPAVVKLILEGFEKALKEVKSELANDNLTEWTRSKLERKRAWLEKVARESYGTTVAPVTDEVGTRTRAKFSGET